MITDYDYYRLKTKAVLGIEDEYTGPYPIHIYKNVPIYKPADGEHGMLGYFFRPDGHLIASKKVSGKDSITVDFTLVMD